MLQLSYWICLLVCNNKKNRHPLQKEADADEVVMTYSVFCVCRYVDMSQYSEELHCW